jgi:hypothetical protein
VFTAIVDGLVLIAIVLSWPALVVVLLGPTRLAVDAALFVAATGLATSVSIVMQGRPGPVDVGVVILAVVAAVIDVLILAIVLLRNPGRSQALRVGALFAAVGALLLPLAQFWHATSWSNIVQKASIGLEPAVEVQGRTADDLFVKVDLKLTNNSVGRVRVIHSAVDICRWSPDEPLIYEPNELLAMPQRCTRWRTFAPRSWVDANASLTGSKTLKVPISSPRLEIIARVAYARGDRLQIASESETAEELPDSEGPGGKCANASFYRVEPDSRARGLAQQEKYLGYADRRGEGGQAYFLVGGRPNRCRDSDPALIDYYGVTELSVVTETWLVPNREVPTVSDRREEPTKQP